MIPGKPVEKTHNGQQLFLISAGLLASKFMSIAMPTAQKHLKDKDLYETHLWIAGH
jgi:hypothetical protein